MYYGNGVNPAGNNTAKWPGYVGVWHMGEASGTAYDSTTNEFNAVAVQNARARAADLVAVADGAVGAARVNQASTTYYDREDPCGAENRRNYLSASVGQDAGLGTRFTFSGWLRTTGYTEGGETVVYKMASGYNWGWSIVRVHTTWNDDVGVNPGEDVWITLRVTDGSKKLTVPNMRNSWVHLFVSFDRIATNDAENPYKTVASAYANGVFLDTVQGSTRGRDNDLPLTFGNINSTTDGQAFSGQYDEMRLKLGASSANWAKAEYLTVTASGRVLDRRVVPETLDGNARLRHCGGGCRRLFIRAFSGRDAVVRLISPGCSVTAKARAPLKTPPRAPRGILGG